ncbi:Xaa-Pro peptidase family protein [soil metagenome]
MRAGDRGAANAASRAQRQLRVSSLPPYARRIARIRSSFAEAGIEALLVTHPPNLRYLTGLDATMGMLLVEATACTLIVDGRYLTAARGCVGRAGELLQTTITPVEGSYEGTLAAVLRRTGRGGRVGVESTAMTLAAFRHLDRALESVRSSGAAVELVPVERVVEAARVVKDSDEIETLRNAAVRLSAVAREAVALARAGRTEREVAMDIDAAIRGGGFTKPAFDTIVASGPNSALPHARPGDRMLGPGDGVVLDFGGVYDGYCVDLTRTVQVAPASAAFRRLFDAVSEAHAAAIAAVRPGVRGSEVDSAARNALARHGLADAFLHGTGHGLGLEVHEEPRISKAGTAHPDEPLKPGMVFTIEPGVYVEGFGGVRIEDDVLVSEQGCEVLTDVPVDPAPFLAGA